MKKLFTLLFLLISFLASIAQTTIDTAINFVAKDIYGNRIELFEFLDDDKIVVIDFFNTSCGPCQTYAPDMQASYTDFGENQGNVIFMGISKGDDNAMVAQFDSIFGITYPSISGSQGGGNAIHTAYNILGTPTVIVITPDKAIVEKHIWEPTRNNINEAVENAGGIMVGTGTIPADDVVLAEIWPNPVGDHARLGFNSEGSEYSFILTDVAGRISLAIYGEYFTEGRQTRFIRTESLSHGLYFLSILQDGKTISRAKLIKN